MTNKVRTIWGVDMERPGNIPFCDDGAGWGIQG